jgi:hypothetical protein
MRDKTRLLTGLMGGKPWSWPVVGVTPAALAVLAMNDFKYVKGINRAHIVPRIETARALFERASKPLGIDDFFVQFLANDRTVIATKAENKVKGSIPPWIPLQPDEYPPAFQCAQVVGWIHRKREVELLRKVCSDYDAGLLALVQS